MITEHRQNIVYFIHASPAYSTCVFKARCVQDSGTTEQCLVPRQPPPHEEPEATALDDVDIVKGVKVQHLLEKRMTFAMGHRSVPHPHSTVTREECEQVSLHTALGAHTRGSRLSGQIPVCHLLCPTSAGLSSPETAPGSRSEIKTSPRSPQTETVIKA